MKTMRIQAMWKCPLVTVLVVTCIMLSVCQTDAQINKPVASPASEFKFSPTNFTVEIGKQGGILKCKIKKEVKTCQWFYLRPGLDFFDISNPPSLVKSFSPSRKHDCSMNFKTPKLEQTGQWVCKGILLNSPNNQSVISQPAFVRVVEPIDEPKNTEGRNIPPIQDENDEKSTELPLANRHFPFIKSDEMNIVNAHIGDQAKLRCLTQSPMKTCDWVKPRGTKLTFFGDEIKQDYEIRGNFSAGECLLLVNQVTVADEGNWRCTVTLIDTRGELLSPLTHLHVLELGINGHAYDRHDDPDTSKRDWSLVVILVTTSLVLLLLVVALVAFLIQRKAWRRQPVHKYYDTNRDGISEYSGYGPWIPELGTPKDPGLLSDQSSTHYNGYLDMSGRSSGRGQPFSDSSLPSALSIRTLGPAPSVPMAVDSRMNKSELNVNSSSTFGNPTFEGNHGSDERTSSVYSNNHLYEDLDQFAKSRLQSEEDNEGYMVPNRRERLPTPPLTDANSYSNIREPGCYPQRDSGFDPSENLEETGPPAVPLRKESTTDSPLASYDVPPRKSQESLDQE